MKTNLILLIAVASATYALTLYLGNKDIKSVPIAEDISQEYEAAQQVPTFTFTDINGNQHSITDFKGKTIILNFWASWCVPCIAEFPLLLQAAHSNNEDVVLIALSSDLDESIIREFLAKLQKSSNINLNSPNILVTHDQGGAITMDLFGTMQLPETILIAPDQTMRHKFIGANWTLEDLQKWLENLRQKA